MASALDIRPHSRRISGLAVLALSLLATGGFALGLSHQVGATGPSPFPQAQGASQTAMADAIPEATPAPELQVATVEPAARHHAKPAADPADDAAPSAEAVPAVDVSATVPDQAPAAPPPAPETAPDTAAPAA